MPASGFVNRSSGARTSSALRARIASLNVSFVANGDESGTSEVSGLEPSSEITTAGSNGRTAELTEEERARLIVALEERGAVVKGSKRPSGRRDAPELRALGEAAVPGFAGRQGPGRPPVDYVDLRRAWRVAEDVKRQLSGEPNEGLSENGDLLAAGIIAWLVHVPRKRPGIGDRDRRARTAYEETLVLVKALEECRYDDARRAISKCCLAIDLAGLATHRKASPEAWAVADETDPTTETGEVWRDFELSVGVSTGTVRRVLRELEDRLAASQGRQAAPTDRACALVCALTGAPESAVKRQRPPI